MYTLWITLQPAAGKIGEVEALVTERLKMRQAQGVNAALSQKVLGEGVVYSLGMRFPDLAGFHAFRTANRHDAEFQTYQAKLGPLLRAPSTLDLQEMLLMPAAGPPPQYVQRVTIYPSLEKLAAVSELLRERLTAAAATGGRGGLSRPVVSEHGPSFQVNILHGDLPAFECATQANEADKEFQKFIGKLAGLIRHPSKMELFEVLVPFTG
jgi:hypothetical protein